MANKKLTYLQKCFVHSVQARVWRQGLGPAAVESLTAVVCESSACKKKCNIS
jgi:hypothetical protein